LSFSALGFLVVYALGLLLALYKHPVFGLYAYLWAFYNHPPAHWWGANLPDLRWSLLAGFVTLIAIQFRQSRTSRPAWYKSGGAIFLIGFTGWMWIQAVWAISSFHSDGVVLFAKYILLFYLIYQIVSDEQCLEMFAWGHVVGCFIFGWIAFRDPVVGRLETVGGPGVDDSNVLGAHLITGIALAGFMFLGISGKRRWIALAAIPFIMNAIILTQSRGAFIGVLAAGLAGWYFAPRTHRRIIYLVAPLAVFLFLRLANDQFWQRMDTIEISRTADIEEKSAKSRIEIIAANWQMFKDHPIGVGYRGNLVLSPQYIAPEFLSRDTGFRAAHNTLMAVLVDTGLPGAILFICLVLWVAYTLWRLNLLDRVGLPPVLGSYRAAIAASLTGLLISGQFLNLFTAEVQIWMIALLAGLNDLCCRSVLTNSATVEPIKLAQNA
jgi:hypothetical protein